MNAPQIILVSLWLVGIGHTIAKHGKPREGKHDAVASSIALVIVLAILWWGGFFGGAA